MIKQRGDDGVDTDGLTRPRRAGNQHVGHLGQIHHHRLTRYILPEHHWNLRIGIVPSLRLDDVSHADGLSNPIGHLDANRALTRHRGENTNRHGLESEGDVLVEVDDLLHPHAGRWRHFIAGDHGAGVNFAGDDFNPKLF